MSDRDEISWLVHRYAECIDKGDFDGVADLFENGQFRAAGQDFVLRGRDEVRKMYDGVVLYDDGTPKTHHVITNVVIAVADGADEATSTCYLTLIQGLDQGGPIQIIMAARYLDTFRRAPGGWEFAERVIVNDMLGDLSRHYPQPVA